MGMNNAASLVGKVVYYGNTTAPSRAKVLSVSEAGVKVRYIRSVRPVSVVEHSVFSHCYFESVAAMVDAYAARRA